jgi:hypothetical protein
MLRWVLDTAPLRAPLPAYPRALLEPAPTKDLNGFPQKISGTTEPQLLYESKLVITAQVAATNRTPSVPRAFDGVNFSFINAINLADPQRFSLLQVP